MSALRPARALTRREALLGAFRRRDAVAPLASPAASHAAPASPPAAPPRVAVIQGRHCLAYRSLACSVCAERCPEPGAIVRERGIPRVVADACTGCGVCRDVCPAPTNAVLVLAPRGGGGAA